MKPSTPSGRALERLVVKHAMSVASHWPDDLSYFKGNNGTMLKMLRACKRLKKARAK